MSLIYIIPPLVEKNAETEAILSRAGVHRVQVEHLHQMWRYIDVEGLTVVEMGPVALSILSRYASQLIEDLPVVVIGFPGAGYVPDWNTVAATYPSIRYAEFETKLLKAGHTAFDRKALESRAPMQTDHQGSTVSERSKKAIFKQNVVQNSDEEEGSEESEDAPDYGE